MTLERIFCCARTCRLSRPLLVSYRKCVLYQENVLSTKRTCSLATEFVLYQEKLFSIRKGVRCLRTPVDFPVRCWVSTENLSRECVLYPGECVLCLRTPADFVVRVGFMYSEGLEEVRIKKRPTIEAKETC